MRRFSDHGDFGAEPLENESAAGRLGWSHFLDGRFGLVLPT